jgi:hypothetical protein
VTRPHWPWANICLSNIIKFAQTVSTNMFVEHLFSVDSALEVNLSPLEGSIWAPTKSQQPQQSNHWLAMKVKCS